MRSVRFVCLFAILISMLVLAQSSRDQLANPPNGLPIAQQRHPALPPNFSQMPQGARFARRGAGTFKAAAPWRLALPMSGLDFANVVDYGSGGYAVSVAVADVNRDGKPDLLVANGGGVGVLLGNGDGTFQTVVTYASGGYRAVSVAVADVNGDGKPDLLVANGCLDSNCDSGGLGVLLGNGDGTFQTAVPYASGGSGADSVAVADVNGDGKPDLLVANECGDYQCFNRGPVGVLLGNGDGTFQTAVPYASGGYFASSVAVADVNGDGKPDLLVANCSGDNDYQCEGYKTGTVGVLLGNGDGTFQTVVPYGSGGLAASSVAVADVNGDGKPDLLVANECGDNQCFNRGPVGVLLGNGDGTFQTVVPYGSGGVAASSVAVADVNGDGKPDLLVANYCAEGGGGCFGAGTVGVLLGNGDGTFQTVVPYASGGYLASSVAVADVNGDGKPDLLVANECATGTEQGGCTNYTGTVGVLLGNGDGTFQTVVTYASDGYRAQSVAVADVNVDGKPDLMLANRCADSSCTTNGTVGVLINTSFTPTKTTLISSQNPSNFGQPVTFTATLTGQQGFDKGTPTGTVSFYDGTTNIGNSNLNSSGVATLTTSTLSVGTHSVTATYNGDTNFLPSTSPVLYQVVQGAIAVFSPTSLNFGSQTVGITSNPQNVTLQNTGNINLAITSIQITGTNSGDFGEKNNCPSSLPPNNSCQISVTFKPTTTGTRNAAVNITNNAPNSPQSVPLTGVGVAPAVTFSPKSLTFATQLVFTTSKAQPVTLTNSGAGVLKINHISVTSPFQQTNNCPSSLGPGAKCTINVKFRPGNKGVFHSAVSVTDNAPSSPQKVPLTGTGTFVQLPPTKLNFGTQPVGTRSLAKTITLTNKGNSTVTITGISITGTDARDFAETNTCDKSVASGASCFIKVTFKPLVKGKRTADVSVYDNGGGSPQKVGLIGTGT